MAYIGTFKPSDIVLAINDYVVTDFAEGSFLEIVQNTKTFTQFRGIRGKHSRIHQRDRSGVINFNLMQTSSDNEVLSRLALEDDLNLTGLLFVIIRDVSGQSSYQFINAYLEGVPDVSYSSGSTAPRQWRINYDGYSLYNVAGNKQSPLDITTGLF